MDNIKTEEEDVDQLSLTLIVTDCKCPIPIYGTPRTLCCGENWEILG